MVRSALLDHLALEERLDLVARQDPLENGDNQGPLALLAQRVQRDLLVREENRDQEENLDLQDNRDLLDQQDLVEKQAKAVLLDRLANVVDLDQEVKVAF